MNPTSAFARFIAPAVVAVLAVGLVAQREARVKAEAEHAALEQQLEILHGIAAENAQLSNLVARASVPGSLPEDDSRELLRLRGEVTALRQKTGNLASALTENRQAHVPSDRSGHSADTAKAAPTADYWPRDSWAFAGYVSPDATLQSSLCAANNGDVKALLACVTGKLQEDIESKISGNDENEMSARLMDQVGGAQSVRILDRAVQPDGTVQVTMSLEGQYDTRTQKVILQQVGNDWKIAGGL